MNLYKKIEITDLPDFLHATHCATFPLAESCIPEVEESASQTGMLIIYHNPRQLLI